MDADLIDVTFDRIMAQGFHPTTSSRAHRAVVMVTTVQGLIDNGGFDYVFGNPFSPPTALELIVEAYREIGAEGSARAFEEAHKQFATEAPDYDAYDRELWDSSAKNYELVKIYIEQNPSEFEVPPNLERIG